MFPVLIMMVRLICIKSRRRALDLHSLSATTPLTRELGAVVVREIWDLVLAYSHILRLFLALDVRALPEFYILKR